MNENEIKQVLEDVRYWLLEDERYLGEQEHKVIAIQRLMVKGVIRSEFSDYKPI